MRKPARKKFGVAMALAAVAVVLSACGGTPLIQVTQKPIVATYHRNVPEDRIFGSSEIVIRSFRGGDPRVEFAGAKCTLRSDDVRASFTTPAIVVVPKYKQRRSFPNRGRPSEVTVNCRAGGEKVITSFFAKDKEVQAATNAGIGGAILSMAVSGAIASSSPWRYPEQVWIEFAEK